MMFDIVFWNHSFVGNLRDKGGWGVPESRTTFSEFAIIHVVLHGNARSGRRVQQAFIVGLVGDKSVNNFERVYGPICAMYPENVLVSDIN